MIVWTVIDYSDQVGDANRTHPHDGKNSRDYPHNSIIMGRKRARIVGLWDNPCDIKELHGEKCYSPHHTFLLYIKGLQQSLIVLAYDNDCYG